MSANNQSNRAESIRRKASGFAAGLKAESNRLYSSGLSTVSVFRKAAPEKLAHAWEKFQDSRDKPVCEIIPDGLFSRLSRPAKGGMSGRLGVRGETKGGSVGGVRDSKALIALSNERALVALENEDETQDNSSFAEKLPLVVIVGGLSSLGIVAILTTGAPQQGSDSIAALAESESAQQVVDSVQPTGQPAAETASSAPVQQLAASVAPVVFEASGNGAAADTRAASLASAEKVRMLEMLERENTLLKRKMAELIEGNVPLMPTVPQRVAIAPQASQQSPVAGVEAEVVQLVDSLQDENSQLKQKMAELESETLSLNTELLQLELSLAEAARQAEPEQRVVYNFVNVPLGGGETVAVQSAPEQFSPPQYVNNELYTDNFYSQEAMSVPDLPPPEMEWDYGSDSSSPNAQMYQDQQVYMSGRPDPYFDPERQMYYHDSAAGAMGSNVGLYGAGADMQYGPDGMPAPPMMPGPPRDLRGFPPVN